jgi:hypothetical protein
MVHLAKLLLLHLHRDKKDHCKLYAVCCGDKLMTGAIYNAVVVYRKAQVNRSITRTHDKSLARMNTSPNRVLARLTSSTSVASAVASAVATSGSANAGAAATAAIDAAAVLTNAFLLTTAWLGNGVDIEHGTKASALLANSTKLVTTALGFMIAQTVIAT